MTAGIVVEDVSKFYGDVLGVNRIDLAIEPGITGLVGANGAGKSTLLNLIAGLLRPDRGRIAVCGETAANPEAFYPRIGYCPQVDGFPPGLTGRELLTAFLKVRGMDGGEADRRADLALERLQLGQDAARRIAAYSKGMRQRIKLAQAVSHEPDVLILDEPLSGLDPEARAQAMDLFKSFADAGAHVLVSTHILHELDDAADRVVFLDGGYVAAAGEIAGIRDQLAHGAGADAGMRQAMQVRIRCEDAPRLAGRLFADGLAHSVVLHDDRAGLLAATDDADAFFIAFNEMVQAECLAVQAVAPADESVQAVFEALTDQGRDA